MSTGEPGDTSEPARAALDAAYAQVLPRLRRLVAGFGFGPADAEDILQATYVQGRQSPPQWRGAGALEQWWHKVAVNACLLEYRRRERFRRLSAEVRASAGAGGEGGRPTGRGEGGRRPGRAEAGPQPAGADVAEAAEKLGRREELERVRRALRDMDESLAAPLVLRYWCEMNATEIGTLLELPPATVRTRLRAARLWLADRLGPPE